MLAQVRAQQITNSQKAELPSLPLEKPPSRSGRCTPAAPFGAGARSVPATCSKPKSIAHLSARNAMLATTTRMLQPAMRVASNSKSPTIVFNRPTARNTAATTTPRAPSWYAWNSTPGTVCSRRRLSVWCWASASCQRRTAPMGSSLTRTKTCSRCRFANHAPARVSMEYTASARSQVFSPERHESTPSMRAKKSSPQGTATKAHAFS
mmetsp:Transcript_34083/g.70263  ORF Transcript_34083/g.70263 Transcript_34083/m.70263 type:complete len:208 (-) Transcript_34083:44-667(-)